MQSDEQKRRTKQKPVVIPWKDARMVRSHSITEIAKNIRNMISNQDLISVNLVGKGGTGKTELAKTLAHLVHQLADESFDVSIFGKEELLNLRETVQKLKPTNHLIIFDDIAFLQSHATPKQIKEVESTVAIIRHLPGGEDVRIVMFKLFQYSKSLSPFLRQNDMTLVSSVDDAEYESLLTMIGKHNASKLNLLKKLQVQVKIGKKDKSFFHYPLGNRGKNYFKYHARHPFLPYLYHDGASCRIVVSPLRTWIDPICQVCDDTEAVEESINAVQQFKDDLKSKFGDKAKAKQIVKIVLKEHGINTYPKRVTQGTTFVKQFLNKKLISMEDLAKAYDLTETRTNLKPARQPEITKEKE